MTKKLDANMLSKNLGNRDHSEGVLLISGGFIQNYQVIVTDAGEPAVKLKLYNAETQAVSSCLLMALLTCAESARNQTLRQPVDVIELSEDVQIYDLLLKQINHGSVGSDDAFYTVNLSFVALDHFLSALEMERDMFEDYYAMTKMPHFTNVDFKIRKVDYPIIVAIDNRVDPLRTEMNAALAQLDALITADDTPPAITELFIAVPIKPINRKDNPSSNTPK